MQMDMIISPGIQALFRSLGNMLRPGRNSKISAITLKFSPFDFSILTTGSELLIKEKI